ncbi:MAG: adenylosuccinate lyase [Deferribacteraceae bacterium]|nr:adenylosuccinate lyase [Deferribacteraceae bacterium]
MNPESYESPFKQRYASEEMLKLFSPRNKFILWRKLWIALAEVERQLGLPITEEQIIQMKENAENIDFAYAAEMEERFRHDVMAHVHAFGKAAPLAKPIIHLGATSCFVGDNADIIIMRDGIKMLQKKIGAFMANLRDFALKYKDLPTLGFTHFQPAQLTTVGKRASLWLFDIYMDLEALTAAQERLMLLGSKGATGTQASFLELFKGDHNKVKTLERSIAQKFGFNKVQPVSGQTYSRKQDAMVLAALAQFSSSANKFATDIRLSAHLKEVEEPFERDQIGSSAMAYKRNPMRSERICSIARFVINLASNAYYTHANQWFERTLDDSANRRLSISEAFLGGDCLAELYKSVSKGLIVNEKVIERHIREELPFMATENIIMQSVVKGGDRQQIHEIIRQHSLEAARRVKECGEVNPLISLLENDSKIPLTKEEIKAVLTPEKFAGRAKEQTEEFIKEYIDPVLEKLEVSERDGRIRV